MHCINTDDRGLESTSSGQATIGTSCGDGQRITNSRDGCCSCIARTHFGMTLTDASAIFDIACCVALVLARHGTAESLLLHCHACKLGLASCTATWAVLDVMSEQGLILDHAKPVHVSGHK